MGRLLEFDPSTLSLEWSQVDRRLTCVIQSTPPVLLDVPLQVEFSDGTALMHSATLASERTEIEIPTEKTVHSVQLDPHYTILHATPELWGEAEARRFITRGKLLWEDDDVDRALELFMRGLEQIQEVDVWGIEFLTRLHIGWMHQQQGRFDEALTEYELALAQCHTSGPPPRPPLSQLRHHRQGARRPRTGAVGDEERVHSRTVARQRDRDE